MRKHMPNSNYEAADVGEGSSSSKDEIIKGLNEDLAREYKAIIQYVVYSSTLKGAEYSDIARPRSLHMHWRYLDRSTIWVEIQR